MKASTGREMQRRIKGFTLIELLVVVAVIAILAAIATPNYLDAVARAKVSRSKSDMRSLGTATNAYITDWGVGPRCEMDYVIQWNTVATCGNDKTMYFIALTTPVGYITRLPKNCNNKLIWNQISTVNKTDAYCIVTAERYWFNNYVLISRYARKASDWRNKPDSIYNRAYQENYQWMFADIGPKFSPKYAANYSNEIFYYNVDTSSNSPNSHFGAKNFPSYDPTNGTSSYGWIVYSNKGFYTIDKSLNF